VVATARRPGLAAQGDVWADRLARFGLLGKAVFHVVFGLLALGLAARGEASEEVSASGVASWIADLPLGVPALWLMAASLAALAVWRARGAVHGDPVEEDDTAHRVARAVKAALYGGLAVTFAGAAASGGSGGGSGGDRTQETASTVFDWPGGRWLVVLAGLAVIAYGGYLVVHHAVQQSFAERLTCPADSTVVTLGRVGYGLRSLAYALVGGLLVQAGLSGEETRAEGLTGAIDQAAASGWGRLLLLGVGVGFVAYGAYCAAETRYRRAT